VLAVSTRIDWAKPMISRLNHFIPRLLKKRARLAASPQANWRDSCGLFRKIGAPFSVKSGHSTASSPSFLAGQLPGRCVAVRQPQAEIVANKRKFRDEG
jgi:hypothetical protein